MERGGRGHDDLTGELGLLCAVPGGAFDCGGPEVAERDALIAKARKKDDKKPGEAARAAFFMRALEKAHQFRNCYECRKAKP